MSRPGLPEIATRFLQAMAGGDTETATSMVGDDFVLRLPAAPRGVPKLITGRGELTGMISNIDRTWSDVGVDVIRADALATDPNRGVAEAVVYATNRDGSAYRNDYVVLVELADGLIHRWTEYYDPTPMVVAIDALRAHLKAAAAGS